MSFADIENIRRQLAEYSELRHKLSIFEYRSNQRSPPFPRSYTHAAHYPSVFPTQASLTAYVNMLRQTLHAKHAELQEAVVNLARDRTAPAPPSDRGRGDGL